MEAVATGAAASAHRAPAPACVAPATTPGMQVRAMRLVLLVLLMLLYEGRGRRLARHPLRGGVALRRDAYRCICNRCCPRCP